MTQDWREDADESSGKQHAAGTGFDLSLNAALATKPSVAIPEGFAAAVAARATQLQQRPVGSPRLGVSWGLMATIGGLTLLLALMIRYALSAPSAIATIAETTFCLEFLMLLLGFLHVRRTLL